MLLREHLFSCGKINRFREKAGRRRCVSCRILRNHIYLCIRKEVETKVKTRWPSRMFCMIAVLGALIFMPMSVEAYHYENKQLGFSMELPAKPTLRQVNGANLLMFPTGNSWGVVITEQKYHERLLSKSTEEIRELENRGITDPRQQCDAVEIDRSGKYPVMLMAGRHNGYYSYLVTAFTGKLMYGFGRITKYPMASTELRSLFESVKSLRVLPNFRGIKK